VHGLWTLSQGNPRFLEHHCFDWRTEMKPRRLESSVGLAPCKNMIASWLIVLGLVAFVTGCALVRGGGGETV